ncbi:MAG: ImmA/IrrE family metallo-endopeptidase [Pseudomonadota bacterium]
MSGRFLKKRLRPEDSVIVDRFSDEYPVKLGGLARELGIQVFSSTMPPGVSGSIERNEDGNFQIRVNRHDKKSRQRFTLAHEIAHFLLHRNLIGSKLTDDILYRSHLSNQQEVEANKLAAELIMPSRLIEPFVSDMEDMAEDEVINLAERFGVSKDAMKIRLGL